MGMGVTLENTLKVYNWFYSLGKPLVSDIKYNQMFDELRRENPNSEVITKTWSELGKPIEALTQMNLLDRANEIEAQFADNGDTPFYLPAKNMEYRDKYYKETLDYFEQFIPKSIETIETVDDSVEWFNNIRRESKPAPISEDITVIDGRIAEQGVDFHFSIKADGFNISLFYYKGHFIGSRTRGRAGSAEEVSIAMSKVVPMTIPVEETYVRIKVEAVMAKDSLKVLREMDPTREWKSPRNSIRTLLMNDIGEEFNKFIIPLAFKAEGKHFDSLEDEFNWLELSGFKVVDNETITINSNIQLINKVKEFSNMDLIYANDGCVVTIDNSALFKRFDTSGKYDYGMRAYRLFNWKSDIYCSLVLSVEPSYNSKRISLGLKIFPTQVSNGSTITTLDADNLSRLQNAKVTRGSVVAFRMRSDSVVDWLDIDSLVINSKLKAGEKVPQHLIGPVAELERRVMELHEDKLNKSDTHQDPQPV